MSYLNTFKEWDFFSGRFSFTEYNLDYMNGTFIDLIRNT